MADSTKCSRNFPAQFFIKLHKLYVEVLLKKKKHKYITPNIVFIFIHLTPYVRLKALRTQKASKIRAGIIFYIKFLFTCLSFPILYSKCDLFWVILNSLLND